MQRWLVVVVSLAGCAAGEPLPYVGVNLAGAEFGGNRPPAEREHFRHYIYPRAEDYAYFAGAGMTIVRVPFRWEQLQPEPSAELDAAEWERLSSSVREGTSRGLTVILDPHNYARHGGRLIGSAELPATHFADLWRRLAERYREEPKVWFGLMNEPAGLSAEAWFAAAQPAVDAIRATGATNWILLPGTAYSGAHSWTAAWYGGANADWAAKVTDPLGRTAIEVHQYLDSDSSGTHHDEVVSETIGVERLRAFVGWCREHRKRAFLGEFAAADTPAGRAAIEAMLRAMEADRDVWLGWTWWAAGPWWGNYPFSLQPGEGGAAKPQMAWLGPFVPGATPPIGP